MFQPVFYCTITGLSFSVTLVADVSWFLYLCKFVLCHALYCVLFVLFVVYVVVRSNPSHSVR